MSDGGWDSTGGKQTHFFQSHWRMAAQTVFARARFLISRRRFMRTVASRFMLMSAIRGIRPASMKSTTLPQKTRVPSQHSWTPTGCHLSLDLQSGMKLNWDAVVTEVPMRLSVAKWTSSLILRQERTAENFRIAGPSSDVRQPGS